MSEEAMFGSGPAGGRVWKRNLVIPSQAPPTIPSILREKKQTNDMLEKEPTPEPQEASAASKRAPLARTRAVKRLADTARTVGTPHVLEENKKMGSEAKGPIHRNGNPNVQVTCSPPPSRQEPAAVNLVGFLDLPTPSPDSEAKLTLRVDYGGKRYELCLKDNGASLHKMCKRFASKINKRKETLESARVSALSSQRAISPRKGRQPKYNRSGATSPSFQGSSAREVGEAKDSKIARIPLRTLMQEQKGTQNEYLPIPTFFAQCIEYLYWHGGRTQLLFRQKAPKEHVDNLIQSANQGKSIDFSSIRDPHVVSNVLKYFLTRLPEPLIGFDIQDSFLAVIQLADEKSQIDQMRKLFMLMNPSALNLLATLCFLWRHILDNKTFTKMTANALGVCCAPMVFWRKRNVMGVQKLKLNIANENSDASKSTMSEAKKVGAAVRLLVEKVDVVFADTTHEWVTTCVEHARKVSNARKFGYPSVALQLLDPSLSIVYLMNEVAEPSVAQALAPDLLTLFEANGNGLFLLMSLIRQEIRSCDNPSTYFRSNTITSNLLTQYCKRIGKNYLIASLKKPIEEVVTSSKSAFVEVNPRKIAENENITDNQMNVTEIVDKIVSAIFESVDQVPIEFCHLAALLQTQVLSKYPSHRHSVVGSFLVLRFISSAIVSPEGWGIVKNVPIAKRRALVLASKVLQNLSNGTEFREPFMNFLKLFMHESTPKIHKFFDTIAERGDNRAGKYVSVANGKPKIPSIEPILQVIKFFQEEDHFIQEEIKRTNDSSTSFAYKDMQRSIAQCPSAEQSTSLWPPLFLGKLLPERKAHTGCIGHSSGMSQIWTAAADGIINRWSTEPARYVSTFDTTLQGVSWILNPATAHGKYLWLGCNNGIEIWDRESNAQVKRMDTNASFATLSSSDRILTPHNLGVMVWDTTKLESIRKVVLRLRVSSIIYGGNQGLTSGLLWIGGEDGTVLCVSADVYGVRCINTENHQSAVHRLCLSEEKLFSGDRKGIINIWQAKTLDLLHHIDVYASQEIRSVVPFSGCFITSIGIQIFALHIESGQVEYRFPSYHAHPVNAMTVVYDIGDKSNRLHREAGFRLWMVDDSGAVSYWLCPMKSSDNENVPECASSPLLTPSPHPSGKIGSGCESASGTTGRGLRATTADHSIAVRFSSDWRILIPKEGIVSVADVISQLKHALSLPENAKQLSSLGVSSTSSFCLHDTDACELDLEDEIEDVWTPGEELTATFQKS